jgi:hypothetical protein
MPTRKQPLPARQIHLARPLSGELIHQKMWKLFPRRNDFGTGSFDELVPELARFGVRNALDFQKLMKKHRRALMRTDRQRLSDQEVEYYAEHFDKNSHDHHRRQFWFAYPAVVRMAAELEFGEAACVREDMAGKDA